MRSSLYQTELPLPNQRRGKVRDIYDVPSGIFDTPSLLIVATDRISAFDVVLPTTFTGKGQLLTEISCQWFRWIEQRGIIAHHLRSTDPGRLPLDSDDQEALRGRIMIGRKTQVVPVECVARGYLTGSGWKEYLKVGSVCGVPIPAGMEHCGQLPEPIFTPTTKAETGHDEALTFEQASDAVGSELMERLRDVTMRLYTEAAAWALERGIIIADTKFEFGFAVDSEGNPTDELLLIDEVLTPDSSRFWPADEYEPGRDQASFDKQIVRNHLQSLADAGNWDKTPPGPEIPPEIVSRALGRYDEVVRRLFG